MKTWIRATLILTALCLGTASAQNLDLIGAYRSIQSSLETARTTLSKDPAGALARVEGAANVFRKVSGMLAPALADGGNTALKNAGTAVSRSSITDFTAQSGQVKAILERGLLEKYLTLFSNPAQALRYASVLGKAFNLKPQAQQDLNASTKAGNSDRARSILELQVATIISNALTNARDNAGNRSGAFASTSRAANNFLIVQDSPRIGELSVSGFTSALTTLMSGDTAGFQQAMGGLLAQVQSFAERSRGLLASTAAPRPANPTPPATQPTPPPATVRPPAATRPAPTPPPVMATTPATPTLAPNITAMKLSLIKAGVAAPRAESLARDLNKQGFQSTEDVINRIYVNLSAALADIQYGSISEGRGSISEARNIFDASLRPVLEAGNPDLAARANRLFEATDTTTGIRPVDVTSLIGEVNTAKHWLNQEPTSSMQALISTVQPWWMGWLRGALFLIVALLFIYPIYLLNLAFGGRNPYWRYIGIAMILLFIPPLLEGLSWLGSFIANGTGLQFFNTLSTISVLQNPLAQMAWVLILFLTVGFATAGFRGIAAQFGLIQTRRAGSTATSLGTDNFGSAEPHAERTATSTQQVATAERTIVEWDEEF